MGCTTPAGERWDNNRGRNYSARHADLKVLTLNLHTYQEDNQDYKFSQIARAINELDIDLICLQEVGENWNGGQGDWNSNAAKIICERLDRHYHLHTDWAHLGFDRYRESVAILSRFPFRHHRKPLRLLEPGHLQHPRPQGCAGAGGRPLLRPGQRLLHPPELVERRFCPAVRHARRPGPMRSHSADIAATIICGDFNIKAGSEGYAHIVHTTDYEDQYLKQTDRKTFDRVFRKRKARLGRPPARRRPHRLYLGQARRPSKGHRRPPSFLGPRLRPCVRP